MVRLHPAEDFALVLQVVVVLASDDHLIDLKIAKVLTAAKIRRNRQVPRDLRSLWAFLCLKGVEEEDLLPVLTSY